MVGVVGVEMRTPKAGALPAELVVYRRQGLRFEKKVSDLLLNTC